MPSAPLTLVVDDARATQTGASCPLPRLCTRLDDELGGCEAWTAVSFVLALLGKEDLQTLFALLSSGAIKPVIAHRLPLLAARESQRLLEAGDLAGRVVLLRSLGLRSS